MMQIAWSVQSFSHLSFSVQSGWRIILINSLDLVKWDSKWTDLIGGTPKFVVHPPRSFLYKYIMHQTGGSSRASATCGRKSRRANCGTRERRPACSNPLACGPHSTAVVLCCLTSSLHPVREILCAFLTTFTFIWWMDGFKSLSFFLCILLWAL